MEEKTKTQTEEANVGEQTERIDGFDLAVQILPLLDDYFCGTFAENTKGVLMKMENGQVFQLTVAEVA